MIDNLSLIKPLLKFDDKEEVFYMLYILKRKKDFPDKLKNAIQSVRTIKSYCVTSLEYLDNRWKEIKMLCEIFQARAYIHVCSQNHKDVALNMINEIINRVKANQHNQKNVFDSVVGQLKVNEKFWIVDIDTKDINILNEVEGFIEYNCDPQNGFKKTRAIIPTKQGFHLITLPFNRKTFSDKFPIIEVQAKNPTLLFLPNSLENI